jgi:transposase
MFLFVRDYTVPPRGVSPSLVERQWLRVLGTLNEYQVRLFAAEKAVELGRGGISRLAKLTGMSRVTITQGIAELQGKGRLRSSEQGQVRKPGAGRKKVEETDPVLRRRLKEIVEETTAGDPMSLLLWTSKSTRVIAEELIRSGHPVSSVTVGRCLVDMGYSLQGNVKTREAPSIPIETPSFII